MSKEDLPFIECGWRMKHDGSGVEYYRTEGRKMTDEKSKTPASDWLDSLPSAMDKFGDLQPPPHHTIQLGCYEQAKRRADEMELQNEFLENIAKSLETLTDCLRPDGHGGYVVDVNIVE